MTTKDPKKEPWPACSKCGARLDWTANECPKCGFQGWE